MPCSICHNIGHNKRTCPSVRPSAANITPADRIYWDAKEAAERPSANDEDCYSSDDEATGVEMWTHPKSGKIYLRDPALDEDGQQELYDYEEFLESGEALHIGWFSHSTGEITFDGEENKVEYETEDEDEEPDIVFCCTGCDKQIIRNSEDHDLSKFDPENEDNWYCVSCPVPEEEDESDDEQVSDEPDEDEPALYWSQLHEEHKKIVGKFNPHAKVMYVSWEYIQDYPEWLCQTRVWVKSKVPPAEYYQGNCDAAAAEAATNEFNRIRDASVAGRWEDTVWE